MSKKIARKNYSAFVEQNNVDLPVLSLWYLNPNPRDHGVDPLALRCEARARGEERPWWGGCFGRERIFRGVLPLPG